VRVIASKVVEWSVGGGVWTSQGYRPIPDKSMYVRRRRRFCKMDGRRRERERVGVCTIQHGRKSIHYYVPDSNLLPGSALLSGG